MSVAEAVARGLEVLVFAGANFVFAAALRAGFKWPRLPERTVAMIAAATLTAPVILAGFLLRDALFMAFAFGALCLNYFAILAGLRFVRPTPSSHD